MKPGKVFRTKTGFCHVLPDKIELTRNGIRGNVSKVAVGNNIGRILVIYTVLAALLFYGAYMQYRSGHVVSAILFASVGIFLVFGVIASLNNSGAPVIERKRIVSIRFIRGISGVTRSRFKVFFRDEKNRIKKRVILMPGSLNGEKEESEKALRIMKEEKLL